METTVLPNTRAARVAPSHELKALAVVLREEFDTPFRFYDSATGDSVISHEQTDQEPAALVAERAMARDLASKQDPQVVVHHERCYLLGFPFDGFGPSRLAAVGIIDALVRSRAEIEQERARIIKWARSVHDRVRKARELDDRRRGQAEHNRQSMIAWEALMDLERLHRSLRIHKEPARDRKRILRVTRELLGASSLAWVSLLGDAEVLIEGERLLSPWDCSQLANQLAEQNLHEQSGYVLINEARESRWGVRFPQIMNLLAVPVAEKTLSGWVLAFNKRQAAGRGASGRARYPAPAAAQSDSGQPSTLRFRRLDAALLMPFASLLGLHGRATERYLFIRDALVGLTRSLTAAIDAKDEYTYGHSERVARAAVELGRELGLQETEQNDMYLAGLLHDVGKIGIRDDVLTKRGPAHGRGIQTHPATPRHRPPHPVRPSGDCPLAARRALPP